MTTTISKDRWKCGFSSVLEMEKQCLNITIITGTTVTEHCTDTNSNYHTKDCAVFFVSAGSENLFQSHYDATIYSLKQHWFRGSIVLKSVRTTVQPRHSTQLANLNCSPASILQRCICIHVSMNYFVNMPDLHCVLSDHLPSFSCCLAHRGLCNNKQISDILSDSQVVKR